MAAFVFLLAGALLLLVPASWFFIVAGFSDIGRRGATALGLGCVAGSVWQVVLAAGHIDVAFQ